MSKRALIIGSDRDYCYVIKEFMELRELHVKVVLDYQEGMDRLSYEKPDLTVIENIAKEICPELPESIRVSSEFEIVDFLTGFNTQKELKTVLYFEDKNHINSLFDFLKREFSASEQAEASPHLEDKGNLSSIFYPSLLVDIFYKKKSGILSISSSAESPANPDTRQKHPSIQSQNQFTASGTWKSEDVEENEIGLDLSYSGDHRGIDNDSTNLTELMDEVQSDENHELELDYKNFSNTENVSSEGASSLFRPYGEQRDENDTELGIESSEVSGGSEPMQRGESLISASDSVSDADIGKLQSQELEKQSERVTDFHAGIDTKDLYEDLGVDRNASGGEIRDAYYRLVKYYHPDVNPTASHDIRVKAEEIFTRITGAYETLIEPAKRELYDSREDLAELKSSAKYIYEAEKKLREALDMNPDEPVYIGAHAWALFLSMENKTLVKEEAKKSLTRALSISDKIPENCYYPASIYKYENNLKKARNSTTKPSNWTRII